MTISIIIARGGSLRLPRKNLKPFCGIPLVAWAIIQSKCSRLIDEVYVSTDDDEIEAVSIDYGAKVIRRPDWPDANLVAANRVYLHALGWLKEKYGDDFDTCVMLLPTTPLNEPDEFDRAISEYRRQGCERLLPLRPLREAVVLDKVSPTRARYKVFKKGYACLGESNSWGVCNPNWYITMFTDWPDTDAILNDINNWPLVDVAFMPSKYWQYADVDTEEEFEFAELLMERYILKGRGIYPYIDYGESNGK